MLNMINNSETISLILSEKTEKAIKTQKLNKAPGSDQITNELLKTTLPVITSIWDIQRNH